MASENTQDRAWQPDGPPKAGPVCPSQGPSTTGDLWVEQSRIMNLCPSWTWGLYLLLHFKVIEAKFSKLSCWTTLCWSFFLFLNFRTEVTLKLHFYNCLCKSWVLIVGFEWLQTSLYTQRKSRLESEKGKIHKRGWCCIYVWVVFLKGHKTLLMGVTSAEGDWGSGVRGSLTFLVNVFILWSHPPPLIRVYYYYLTCLTKEKDFRSRWHSKILFQISWRLYFCCNSRDNCKKSKNTSRLKTKVNFCKDQRRTEIQTSDCTGLLGLEVWSLDGKWSMWEGGLLTPRWR